MLEDFVIGSFISVVVMLVHIFSTIIIRQVLSAIRTKMHSDNILFLVVALVAFYIIAFMTLIASVAIWAAAYFHLGFTATFIEALYTAMINYTTLGLGDLNPAIKQSMYGPMAAASGILMFSWSAALLMYVVQMHLPLVRNAKD